MNSRREFLGSLGGGILFTRELTPLDQSPFDGGDGSTENPYQISTIGQIQSMTDLDASYILVDDIDAGNVENFEPLGGEPLQLGGNGLTGEFDGDNHSISGLTINRSSTDFVGIFRSISGIVKNLTVTDYTIS